MLVPFPAVCLLNLNATENLFEVQFGQEGVVLYVRTLSFADDDIRRVLGAEGVGGLGDKVMSKREPYSSAIFVQAVVLVFTFIYSDILVISVVKASYGPLMP